MYSRTSKGKKAYKVLQRTPEYVSLTPPQQQTLDDIFTGLAVPSAIALEDYGYVPGPVVSGESVIAQIPSSSAPWEHATNLHAHTDTREMLMNIEASVSNAPIKLGEISIYPNQRDAAHELMEMLRDETTRQITSIVVLLAETQAGKTGTYLKLIEQWMQYWSKTLGWQGDDSKNCARVVVSKPSNDLFNDLKNEQEKSSLGWYYGIGHLTPPEADQIIAWIQKRMALGLRSLLVIDEGHLGLKTKSLWDRIFAACGVNPLQPRSEWKNQHLDIVVVSATPYVWSAANVNRLFAFVKLANGPDYYSLADLVNSGRLRDNGGRYTQKEAAEYIEQVFLPDVRRAMADAEVTAGHVIIQVWTQAQAQQIRQKLTRWDPTCKVYVAGKPNPVQDVVSFTEVSTMLRMIPTTMTYHLIVNTGNIGARVCTKFLVGGLLRNPKDVNHATIYQALGRWLGNSEWYYLDAPGSRLHNGAKGEHYKRNDIFPIHVPVDPIREVVAYIEAGDAAVTSTHNRIKVVRTVNRTLRGYRTKDELIRSRAARGLAPITEGKLWGLAEAGSRSDEVDARAERVYHLFTSTDYLWSRQTLPVDAFYWPLGQTPFHSKVSSHVRVAWKPILDQIRRDHPGCEYFDHDYSTQVQETAVMVPKKDTILSSK